MPTVTTDDGINISYRVFGTGPSTLLFVHGWAGSGAYFDETLSYLDLTGLRAVTFDLRGHGDSDKPDTGYTDERFARDAFAIADAIGADQVVVIGFSMSGRFAQYLSVLAPDRVRGQVLVSGCPASPISFPEDLRRDWVARAGNAELLKQVTEMYTTKPVPAEVLSRIGDEAAKADKIALDETLRICMYESFVEKLVASDLPTLIVVGIHDSIFSPDVLRSVVAAPFKKARIALLDSNHEVPIEQPREFAALIEAFVAGVQ
jgi:pimeloyl-ACP methyl ester carboxylesterase